MNDAGNLAVFEERLAALDRVAFGHAHTSLHAGKVVCQDRDLCSRCALSNDLKWFPRNREVEALLNLMQCHDRSVWMLGQAARFQRSQRSGFGWRFGMGLLAN